MVVNTLLTTAITEAEKMLQKCAFRYRAEELFLQDKIEPSYERCLECGANHWTECADYTH